MAFFNSLYNSIENVQNKKKLGFFGSTTLTCKEVSTPFHLTTANNHLNTYKIKINSVSIPRKQYTLPSVATQYSVDNGASYQSLTAGDYTATTLIEELNTNTVGLEYSYSSTTSKVSLTSTSNCSMVFHSFLSDILGFESSSFTIDAGETIEAAFCLDLFGPRFLYIFLEQDTRSYGIGSLPVSNTSLLIYDNYQNPCEYSAILSKQEIQLTIKFRTKSKDFFSYDNRDYQSQINIEIDF